MPLQETSAAPLIRHFSFNESQHAKEVEEASKLKDKVIENSGYEFGSS
jgi:hypothetical protein